jgi:hypothetical protein
VIRRLHTAALGAFLVSGCVDYGSSLTIVQNQLPTTEGAESRACVIPSMASALRNALGTFDVALDKSYPYYMYPLVSNGLPTLSGTVDPNIININKFSVKIEAPPTVTVPWTPACPAEFDFPSPLPLHPLEQAAAIVEAIRPCHYDLLHQLMAEGKLPSSFSERVIFRLIIRAKGRHGSTEIKSDPFEFPVRVCYGCLQTGYNTAAYADFNFPKVPSCNRLAETNPFPGNPCNPAQDFGPLLCCALDAEGKQLECPGIARGITTPTMP